MKRQTAWPGKKIRKLRKRLGMTQSAFASEAGVRQATISDWERGKKKVSRMGTRILDSISLRVTGTAKT